MADTARIIIVDENDNVIAHKERGTVAVSDIYRVSSLWITNTRGDVLLAQRTFAKGNNPGKWAAAVNGTVDEGETYDSNIIKEMEEEIGLTGIVPTKGKKMRISNQHNFFVQRYTLCIDRPAESFTIQEDEVERVRWFTRAELDTLLRHDPTIFVPDFESALRDIKA